MREITIQIEAPEAEDEEAIELACDALMEWIGDSQDEYGFPHLLAAIQILALSIEASQAETMQ
jgi:hypothetical protein